MKYNWYNKPFLPYLSPIIGQLDAYLNMQLHSRRVIQFMTLSIKMKLISANTQYLSPTVRLKLLCNYAGSIDINNSHFR